MWNNIYSIIKDIFKKYILRNIKPFKRGLMGVIMIKGKQNLVYTTAKVLVAGVTALTIFGSACSSTQKAEDIVKQPKSYQVKENAFKEDETQYKGTHGNNEQGM